MMSESLPRLPPWKSRQSVQVKQARGAGRDNDLVQVSVAPGSALIIDVTLLGTRRTRRHILMLGMPYCTWRLHEGTCVKWPLAVRPCCRCYRQRRTRGRAASCLQNETHRSRDGLIGASPAYGPTFRCWPAVRSVGEEQGRRSKRTRELNTATPASLPLWDK